MSKQDFDASVSGADPRGTQFPRLVTTENFRPELLLSV